MSHFHQRCFTLTAIIAVLTSCSGTKTSTAGAISSATLGAGSLIVSPGYGSLSGGTKLTIKGAGFLAGSTTVDIGKTSCISVQVSDASTLNCLTPPAQSSGPVDVVVAVGGKTVASATNGFTYLSPLSISAISPA